MRDTQPMEMVLITGMSGSGKSVISQWRWC
jgi:dephospho-CoA kinase